MLSASFEAFSQSLRILLEAVLRSNELILVDPHEASGNIEQGFTNLLNSFHSLYDSARGEKGVELDWYGTPEIATILAIRNARHHNIANKIRGLYAYQLQQKNPANFTPYVIVDYPETEDGGDTFETLISWGDMDQMLSLPTDVIKLRSNVPTSIRKYLNSDLMNAHAHDYKLDKQSVFFNATPLIVNAAIKVIPAIKAHVNTRSTEATWFLKLFESVLPADTQRHKVSQITIFLPT